MHAGAGWPWIALALLGAFHGLNPAMGWLFAVAFGLQERSRRALLRTLPSIACGHAAAIAAVVLLAVTVGRVVPARSLQIGAGLLVLSFGLWKVATRFRHPRWVGMHLGARDLVVWSFVMASAHGAGLMLLPVVLYVPAHNGKSVTHGHLTPLASAAGDASIARALAAVGVHTAALAIVSTVVALVVYEVIGVEILRRAWLNLDVLWVGALIVAAILTLLLPVRCGRG